MATAIHIDERSPVLELYNQCHRVNVAGTANVIDTARSASTSILIATSSASIAMAPVGFWVRPWQSEPADYAQLYGESDLDAPLRPYGKFSSVTMSCKAMAKRLVCGTNEAWNTRYRAGNAVYGQIGDQLVGSYC